MEARKTESKLAKAVLNVMRAVEQVEKGMTVGEGKNSYKAVSDADVKRAYRQAMIDNELIILPVDINDNVHINRWVDNFGAQKQSVLTTALTTYKLMHSSGEYEFIKGYGHGVDPSDKGAGKSTTYALKYALLYTFMTPTLNIDDADREHSDDAVVPNPATEKKEWLNEGDKNWKSIMARYNKGEKIDISVIKKHFNISKATEEILKSKLEQPSK